ncbi:MORC family CW-type zinc finger protein 3a isoform X1 [Phyllopteryx taeniolatus]|uniref:MORC family CW-type zinc finger protein 3a isoform X1 n=2 Tax=Phyllopteryx taeniolatus TaxID=161469 RepID=UPI002AD29736|nr:MORC family CW-type zinc finger protein 3a isoform X1 [Phyllopteryx taeniolatus]
MAVQQDRGVPLSTLSPKYLHTNSTSHTWPFSAIAELIDNAYDPDVLANAFWIDKTVVKGHDCLSFMDNGNGLDHEAMHKMLSFGYSDKVSVKGVEPIGMYGNGFKSGSMRLGRDAIVFSRSKNASCVGMLSQTYLEKINAQQIIVPIVCFEHTDGNLCVREEHRASLQDILHYSPFVTETDLLTEISAITSTCSTATTGTRIIIWNLRRTSTEALEFDFQADRYDIQIPSDVYEDLTSAGDRIPSHIPESVYSLRAYCSILYLKPRMHVIIRGQKVKTQLIAKSLANSKTDHYKPISLTKRIPIIFGYNTKSTDHYGIMMYHKNRLIKAYERIGCQLKPNSKGVGVIGVIECNFLEPMHNKQSFSENDKYRKTMASLTIKLDEYCNEIRYRLTRDNPDRKVEVDDISKRADQNWVMCDLCRKWRKLPDGIDCSRLPDSWFCHMNPDPQFRNCEAEEEAQDSDDEQPSYRKTYKQKEREDKKKLMSKQKVEADRRRWEERRMAKLTLQNQALRQQEEDLKRKLHQKTVHSPTTPTTSERRLNMDSVQETSSSPGVTAVSGTSPSSNGFPIISSVYSLSTSPSRKKRRMSAESQSTPKSHRQNLFQEGASDGSSSVDVSPLRNEAFEPKEFMGLVNEGSSSPAPPPGISQMEAPQIKGEKEDKAIIKQNPDQTECGAVATAERGTQFSRMIKRENNTQSINESNQTVYIASDDDNEITESLEWPMETKEQQDVDHEERLENILPFTVNCLHQSSQTEETLPDKDYKSLFEKAEEKIHQLVSSRADLLETARIKPSATQAEEDLGNITWQVDSLVRELDQRTMERNQLRSQLKNVKLEKANLSSQCQELRMRLQQAGGQTQESGSRAPLQNEDLSTQPANSPTNSEYFKRLVELRYNIGRLLVNRVPYLDLGQVNYECDVIDEILEQYLTVNSSDRSDAPCSK